MAQDLITKSTIVNLFYSMGQITKEEVFTYVCNGVVTRDEYKNITQEDCPEIPIDTAKTLKKNDISQTCRTILYGGFKSSVHYGVEKIFNTALEDQTNIIGNSQAATSKLSGVQGCQNDKFYYAASGCMLEEWTADDVAQLGREFKAFRENTLFRSKALQAYVDTITTTSSDVFKVDWNTDISNFLATYVPTQDNPSVAP